MPRVSSIPPAATTGISMEFTTCGTREIDPVRESSEERRNDPRCPPVSNCYNYVDTGLLQSDGLIRCCRRADRDDALVMTLFENFIRRIAVDEREGRHLTRESEVLPWGNELRLGRVGKSREDAMLRWVQG